MQRFPFGRRSFLLALMLLLLLLLLLFLLLMSLLPPLDFFVLSSIHRFNRSVDSILRKSIRLLLLSLFASASPLSF
jgi:hypothetical protein